MVDACVSMTHHVHVLVTPLFIRIVSHLVTCSTLPYKALLPGRDDFKKKIEQMTGRLTMSVQKGSPGCEEEGVQYMILRVY